MAVPFIFKRLSADKTLLYTWFEAMHTRIDVVFCHLPEEKAKSLAELIGEELQRLEKILNRFDPSATIAIVNQKAGKEKVVVTKEFFNIIQSCIDYNRQTQGYFDITIHSFNHYKDGIRGIVLDEEASAISFAHPDIQLDLGGFGKGYALDRCKIIVENNHCHDALLSFGNSSVLALGNHPLGEGWKIGLENISRETHSSSIILYNECLTTSGNKSEEKKHIISPISGKYVEEQRTISVKTSSGVLGEVLSTALFAATAQFPASVTDSKSLLRQLNFHSFVDVATILDSYTCDVSTTKPSNAI